MATLSLISFVTASPMIVLLVLYWLVPPGRGAVGTGNQLSSDHFERAVDYFGPGFQEIETFPDFRISGLDEDLSDPLAHCA
jgi:hypothetical protein